MLKEDEVGSSIFVSKTKRQHSVSSIPGPGSYEINIQKEAPYSSGNFGSSVERNTNITKNDARFPFTEPTYLENPPVGYYNGSKFPKRSADLKAVKQKQDPSKLQNQLIIKGSRTTKEGFNSTSKRELNRTLYNNGVPGPGAYDLTFRDIIKTMDQKLAIRYQISPFGSGKPRFTSVNNTIDFIKEDPNDLSGIPAKDKHLVSDLMNQHYKNRDSNKNSYSFASKVSRLPKS